MAFFKNMWMFLQRSPNINISCFQYHTFYSTFFISWFFNLWFWTFHSWYCALSLYLLFLYPKLIYLLHFNLFMASWLFFFPSLTWALFSAFLSINSTTFLLFFLLSYFFYPISGITLKLSKLKYRSDILLILISFEMLIKWN